MKNLRKFIFVFAFTFFTFFGVVGDSHAAKPSDFGLKEGDLISAIFSDDPDVYIVNKDGYKRLFLNQEIFSFYGHLGGFFNVKLVPQEVVDAFPTSGLFRNCEAGDPKVFGVTVEGEDSGIMSWINLSGNKAVSEDPNFFKKVFCVNDKEFKWYPKKGEFKSLKSVPKYERIKHKLKELKAKKKKLKEHKDDDDNDYYEKNLKKVGKILLCHKGKKTVNVSLHSLRGHLRHGDEIGACSIVSNPRNDDDNEGDEDDDQDEDSEDEGEEDENNDNNDDDTDTTAPIISSLSVSSATDSSVIITWTTDENATSKVYYATSTPVVATSTTDFVAATAFVTSHSIELTGLMASTTYYFLVESTDASSNTAGSSEFSFTTQ